MINKTAYSSTAIAFGDRQQKKEVSASSEFADTLKQALTTVNDAHVYADMKVANLATGKDKDIHGTMIALEKAEISTKLLLGVRNKMVGAYQEVMRMQI